MWFLATTLTLTTLLLCYAGYVFLVVDRRQEAAVLEDPDLYEALDDKNYIFELPEQVDTYEDLRTDEPADKCVKRSDTPPHTTAFHIFFHQHALSLAALPCMLPDVMVAH